MSDTLSNFKALAHAAAEALRHTETTDIYLEPVAVAWQLADSPIEKDMGQAIICCAALNGGVLPKVVRPDAPLTGNVPLIVAPQRWIGEYRADFALIHNPTSRRLVVECDGHEFHEKASQRDRDKARDRYFLTRGWPVMRFTGSEIHRQLDLCLADVVAYLTGEPA